MPQGIQFVPHVIEEFHELERLRKNNMLRASIKDYANNMGGLNKQI